MSVDQYIKTFNPKRQFMNLANYQGGLDLIDYLKVTEINADIMDVGNFSATYGQFYALESELVATDQLRATTIDSYLVRWQSTNFAEDGFYVGFKSTKVEHSTIWTLPPADGANKQTLTTDGKGNLYWNTADGGGSVVGPDKTTINAVALWANDKGTVLANSKVIVSEEGEVSGVKTLTATGDIVTAGAITATKAVKGTDLILASAIDPFPTITFKTTDTEFTGYTLTFPQDVGEEGQVLVTNGKGILSWSSAGGDGKVTSIKALNSNVVVDPNIGEVVIGLGDSLDIKTSIAAPNLILNNTGDSTTTFKTNATISQTWTFPSMLPATGTKYLLVDHDGIIGYGASGDESTVVNSVANDDTNLVVTPNIGEVTVNMAPTVQIVTSVGAPNLIINAGKFTTILKSIAAVNQTWTFPSALPVSGTKYLVVNSAGAIDYADGGEGSSVVNSVDNSDNNLIVTPNVGDVIVNMSEVVQIVTSVGAPNLIINAGDFTTTFRSSATTDQTWTFPSALPVSGTKYLVLDSAGAIGYAEGGGGESAVNSVTSVDSNILVTPNIGEVGISLASTVTLSTSITSPNLILSNDGKNTTFRSSATTDQTWTFPSALPVSGTKYLVLDKNGVIGYADNAQGSSVVNSVDNTDNNLVITPNIGEVIVNMADVVEVTTSIGAPSLIMDAGDFTTIFKSIATINQTWTFPTTLPAIDTTKYLVIDSQGMVGYADGGAGGGAVDYVTAGDSNLIITPNIGEVIVKMADAIQITASVTSPSLILTNSDKTVELKTAATTDQTWTFPSALPDTGTTKYLIVSSSGAVSYGGAPGGGAPSDATYILQTPSAALPNAQSLNALSNGIMMKDINGKIKTVDQITLEQLPSLYLTVVPEPTGFYPQVFAGTATGAVEVSNILGGIGTDLTALNVWKLSASFIAASGIPGVTFPGGQRLEDLPYGSLLRTVRELEINPYGPSSKGFITEATLEDLGAGNVQYNNTFYDGIELANMVCADYSPQRKLQQLSNVNFWFDITGNMTAKNDQFPDRKGAINNLANITSDLAFFKALTVSDIIAFSTLWSSQDRGAVGRLNKGIGFCGPNVPIVDSIAFGLPGEGGDPGQSFIRKGEIQPPTQGAQYKIANLEWSETILTQSNSIGAMTYGSGMRFQTKGSVGAKLYIGFNAPATLNPNVTQEISWILPTTAGAKNQALARDDNEYIPGTNNPHLVWTDVGNVNGPIAQEPPTQLTSIGAVAVWTDKSGRNIGNSSVRIEEGNKISITKYGSSVLLTTNEELEFKYIGFRAPNTAFNNLSWILPDGIGSAGNVLMRDGVSSVIEPAGKVGVLKWGEVPITSGNPKNKQLAVWTGAPLDPPGSNAVQVTNSTIEAYDATATSAAGLSFYAGTVESPSLLAVSIQAPTIFVDQLSSFTMILPNNTGRIKQVLGRTDDGLSPGVVTLGWVDNAGAGGVTGPETSIVDNFAIWATATGTKLANSDYNPTAFDTRITTAQTTADDAAIDAAAAQGVADTALTEATAAAVAAAAAQGTADAAAITAAAALAATAIGGITSLLGKIFGGDPAARAKKAADKASKSADKAKKSADDAKKSASNASKSASAATQSATLTNTSVIIANAAANAAANSASKAANSATQAQIILDEFGGMELQFSGGNVVGSGRVDSNIELNYTGGGGIGTGNLLGDGKGAINTIPVWQVDNGYVLADTLVAIDNLSNDLSTPANIILNKTVDGDVISLTLASGATSAYTITLPPDSGTEGYFLSTDGSGVTTWVPGTGTGTVIEIQTGANLTGGPITTQGTIALNTKVGGLESLSSNTVIFSTPSNDAGVTISSSSNMTGYINLILPATLVANGYLKTDGSGNLSWNTITSADGNVIGKSTTVGARSLPVWPANSSSNLANTNITIDDDDNLITGGSISTSNVNIIAGSKGAQKLSLDGSPNQITDLIFTFPADIKAGQFLTTDGTGNLSGPTGSGDGNVTGKSDVNGQYTVPVWAADDSSDLINTNVKINGDNITIPGNIMGSKLALMGNATKAVVLQSSAALADIIYFTLPIDIQAGKFLTTNNMGQLSWASGGGGSGTVVGPELSTNRSIATWDGDTGTALLDNPKVTISAFGRIITEEAIFSLLGTVRLGPTANSLGLHYNLSGSTDAAYYNLQFPTQAPSNNQIMQSDDEGILSWINTPTGGGDITGPDTSTKNSVVIWNSVDGKEVTDSDVLIESGNIIAQGTTTTTEVIIPANDGFTLSLTKSDESQLNNVVLKLPKNVGQEGQVLTTDGLGNLYWSTVQGGTTYIVGSGDTVENAIATWATRNGAVVKNSLVTIDPVTQDVITPGIVTCRSFIFNGL